MSDIQVISTTKDGTKIGDFNKNSFLGKILVLMCLSKQTRMLPK